MVYPLKLYFKHRVTLILITASLCVNAAIGCGLLLSFRLRASLFCITTSSLVSMKSGIGQNFFVLLGLALLFANAMLGWLSWDRDAYMAHLLNFIGLLCQVFLLISAVLLVALNV